MNTNNTASATQTPQRADLALAKSVSNAAPNVGDTITYTVTLSNNGPDAATSVQVTDLLPAGVSFVSDTPSQGTYNSVSGLWTVGTVTTAAPQTLLLTATVVGAGAGDQYGDDHACGPVRPRLLQQYGERDRDAGRSRPGAGQERERPHAQRG